MQILMPNATTMIIVSNLHKMHLTLGDNGCWVRAHIAPPLLLVPPTIGKGSTTQALRGPLNMIVTPPKGDI